MTKKSPTCKLRVMPADLQEALDRKAATTRMMLVSGDPMRRIVSASRSSRDMKRMRARMGLTARRGRSSGRAIRTASLFADPSRVHVCSVRWQAIIPPKEPAALA